MFTLYNNSTKNRQKSIEQLTVRSLKINSKSEVYIVIQKKAFSLKRIPECTCNKKETAKTNIFTILRNGDRKIMQSTRIMSKLPAIMRRNRWINTTITWIKQIITGEYICVYSLGFRMSSNKKQQKTRVPYTDFCTSL